MAKVTPKPAAKVAAKPAAPSKVPAKPQVPAKAKAQEMTKADEALPDFMRGMQGQGTEGIGAGDTEIPRIKLMQALSEEIQTFDGLKVGDFFHSIAEESFGQSFLFVPVYIDRRYILWRPRGDGGGILARADDGVNWNPPQGSFKVKLKGGAQVEWKLARTVAESGLAEWGSENPADPNSPPAATLMYNVACMLPEHPELSPCVFTFQRSTVSIAKKFMGKLKISRAPSYGMVFEMASVDDQGPEGPFKNVRVIGQGFVQDQDAFARYKEMYEVFRGQGLKIRDEESLQTEGGDAGGDKSGGDY